MIAVKNERELSEFLVGIVPKDMADDARKAMENPEESIQASLTAIKNSET